MLRGREPVARGGGQVRIFGGVRGESGTGEARAHGAKVREGGRDGLHHDEPNHPPHRSSILHGRGRHISHCHPTKGEANPTLASTQRSLDPRACLDFRRNGPRLGGYHTLLPPGTLVDGINRTRHPVHVLGENNLEGNLVDNHHPINGKQYWSNSKIDYPLNFVTSIIFPTHTHNTVILSPNTHIPNTTTNIQKNKHTITLDHALLLITGKNNTYPFTLREKPSHKKTYNKYTHHLKIKREKELTLLFYISCIQNKKHKENQKQKEKKKNEKKKEHQTFNHTTFYLKTTLWRKINTYNNTKRTNHQKRKSARIWTYRKNTLRTLTELTKHYPIFRNNIRSLYRSIQIKIRRITSKLCNQLSRAFYTKLKKYTQGSREKLFIQHPPKSNIPNQTIHPNTQHEPRKNLIDKQPDNRLRTLLKKLIPSFVMNEKGGMEGGGFEQFLNQQIYPKYPNLAPDFEFAEDGTVLKGPVFAQFDAGPDRYSEISLTARIEAFQRGLILFPGLPNGKQWQLGSRRLPQSSVPCSFPHVSLTRPSRF